MNNNKSLILMLSGLVFAGCASTPLAPVKLEPQIIGHAYDVTSPDQLGRLDTPVWVLPTVIRGYERASADGGQWKSGRLTATVVEPGHWATLEEAERANRPYIVPGEDSGRYMVPGTGAGAGYALDVGALQGRVNKIEQKMNDYETGSGMDPDVNAAYAARLAALGQAVEGGQAGASQVTPDAGGYSPSLRVPSSNIVYGNGQEQYAQPSVNNQPAYPQSAPQIPPPSGGEVRAGDTVILRSMSAGTEFTVPSQTFGDLRVMYVTPTQILITDATGASRRYDLRNTSDALRLTFPRSQN